MCKKTDYKTPNTRIDKCMRNFIHFLDSTSQYKCRGKWHTRFNILACCCGHGKYPPTVVIDVGLNDMQYPVEIFSGKRIFRLTKFYKRDKQGYYYIPETVA